MNKFFSAITRRRYFDLAPQERQRTRHIGSFQLTMICIGCIIGSGIYTVTGFMIKKQAGPATIIAFLIAAVLNMLYGLVYAEVGTRMPHSSSFYAFGYAIYGEFTALSLGMLFLLSHVFGASTMNQAMTFYIDTLCNNAISSYFSSLYTVHSNYLMGYFSPLPILMILGFLTIFMFKDENSKKIAIFFVVLNGLILFTVVVSGARLADAKNWKIKFDSNTSTSTYGKGGFAPYGFSGIIVASVGAFFSLAGFDIIVVIVSEVKNPVRTIPISIVSSLLIASLAYISSTIVISMMTPYYLTDVGAPFAAVFHKYGEKFLAYSIALGCISGIISGIYGEIIAVGHLSYYLMLDNLIPKVFYAKDSDVMIKRNFLISGVIVAFFSVFVATEILVEMTGLSLTISMTILNIMVVNIRYSDKYVFSGNYSEASLLTKRKKNYCRILLAIPTIFSLVIAFITKHGIYAYRGNLFILIFGSIISLSCLLMLWRMPMLTDSEVFKTPFMPFLPVLSNLFTFIICVHIRKESWIMFGTIFGLCVLSYLLSTFISTRKNTTIGDKNQETKALINEE